MFNIKKAFCLSLITISVVTSIKVIASDNKIPDRVQINPEKQNLVLATKFQGDYLTIEGNIYNYSVADNAVSFMPTNKALPHITIGSLQNGKLDFHITYPEEPHKRYNYFTLEFNVPETERVKLDQRKKSSDFSQMEAIENLKLANGFANAFIQHRNGAVIREYNKQFIQTK